MIVVCGEALMDVFVGDTTATGCQLDARVGGSPFNVARGLARLGQRCTYFGALSQDFLGQRLLQALAEDGVDTAVAPRVPQPTSLSLVGTDARGQPHYGFHGAGGADRQLQASDLSAVPAAQAVHLGSYSLVVEPCASTLMTLVAQRSDDTVISYDPNVRLGIEPDTRRWRDRVDAMLDHVALLKVSAEDLALLWPGVPPAELAARWRARGVALVVVTAGADGADAYVGAQRLHVDAPAVPVVDTVGAGDTFQAALLSALAERQVLSVPGLRRLDADTAQAAITWAADAAAITCQRRGADLPRRSEVTRATRLRPADTGHGGGH